MLVKTHAIVLHALKYGERRLIVDMFTRQHGRQAFIVNLPQRGRRGGPGQLFQPLTLLVLECELRPQVQLQKLREVSLLAPLPRLLGEPRKLAIAMFVAEFLYHALKDEQQNVLLFDYIRSSIEWLDGCDGHFANFHLVFLMRLSRFLGFYPNLEGSPRAHAAGRSCAAVPPPQYFDLRGATFCPAPPLHHDFLMPQEAGRIGMLMRMDYPTMHLFRLSRAERNRILEILLQYYRLHLPDFPELRSLGVLHELFSS